MKQTFDDLKLKLDQNIIIKPKAQKKRGES